MGPSTLSGVIPFLLPASERFLFTRVADSSGTPLVEALNIFLDDEPDGRHPGYDAHGLFRYRPYALATLKHIILYVLSNRFRFLFVLSAFDQIGPPYLSMDSATLASSLRLLAITAELLDIILESAAIAVDALLQAYSTWLAKPR